MIIGIDEVGRGPWAGPLVVCAVGFENDPPAGLTDSKKLTKKRREALTEVIKAETSHIGISSVPAHEIDRFGLSVCLQKAVRHAISQIKVTDEDRIVIDGTVNFLVGTEYESQTSTLKQADLLISSVSAASIVAKTARDRFMELQDKIYQGYGFANHVGYGTAKHRSAIERLGVTPLHRLSFAPIAKFIDTGSRSDKYPEGSPVAPTTIGNIAEDRAEEFLKVSGFKIVDRNWKTKWCEVDIIAERQSVIYFVEVKYRRTLEQGGGISAITPTKLKQMKFSAEMWMNRNGIRDAVLSVIEVTGNDYEVTMFLEQVQL